MPNDSAETKIPEEAMNAFLDGIVQELASPSDPATLTRVRAMFRKRIPLHMRSYAAALLIMRAAGLARVSSPKTAYRDIAPEAVPAKEAPSKAPPKPQKEVPAPKKRNPSPQLAENTVPLFVSMGKRQRLHPQELRVLVSEKTGIPPDQLGRVHLFDNYSFLDVQESHVEKVISSAEGLEYKGRTVEIKPAKKRGDAPAEKDKAE
ncbi:MAG: DbpA RNA binding domain-containing protein [Spirochaetes bacterium]|nr:MAG: DbpA RNA binding domain-containing protein [Spirochaetota bacterium]